MIQRKYSQDNEKKFILVVSILFIILTFFLIKDILKIKLDKIIVYKGFLLLLKLEKGKKNERQNFCRTHDSHNRNC